MLPGLDTQTGALPLGRFGVTLDEIKRDFVDADCFLGSSTRRQIWQDFWSATAGLRSIVPVISLWVGGSFLTNKLDPTTSTSSTGVRTTSSTRSPSRVTGSFCNCSRTTSFEERLAYAWTRGTASGTCTPRRIGPPA